MTKTTMNLTTLALLCGVGNLFGQEQPAQATALMQAASMSVLPFGGPVLRDFYVAKNVPAPPPAVPCQVNAPCAIQAIPPQVLRGQYGTNGVTDSIAITVNVSPFSLPMSQILIDSDRNPNSGGTWIVGNGAPENLQILRGADYYIMYDANEAVLWEASFSGKELGKFPVTVAGNTLTIEFPHGLVTGDGNVNIGLITGEYPNVSAVPMSPAKGIGRLRITPNGDVFRVNGKDDQFDITLVLEQDNISSPVTLLWFYGNTNATGTFSTLPMVKGTLAPAKGAEYSGGQVFRLKFSPSWFGDFSSLPLTVVAVTSDGLVQGSATMNLVDTSDLK